MIVESDLMCSNIQNDVVISFEGYSLFFKFKDDTVVVEYVDGNQEHITYVSSISLKILKEIKLIHDGKFKDYIMSFVIAGSICECLLCLDKDIKQDLDNDKCRNSLKCFIEDICKKYGIRVVLATPSMVTTITKLSNRYVTYFVDESAGRYNGYKVVNMKYDNKFIRFLISLRLNKLSFWNNLGEKFSIKYESVVVNDIFSREVHMSILYSILMLYFYHIGIKRNNCNNEPTINLNCDEFIKYLS